MILVLGIPRQATGRVFVQEAFHGRPGAASPTLEILPAQMPGLTDHEFGLDGRRLLIRTNLGPEHRAGIDSVAAVVRRCYRFLERASGRRLEAGVLLYVLEFPERPRCYRFRTEVPDDAGWGQIRVALLGEREADAGLLAARHVTELLFDTLPHELAHGLIAAEPTLRHDTEDEPAVGTRWFIEGVCEKWAKDFARREAPGEWRRGVERRRLDHPAGNPHSETDIWEWDRSATGDWQRESDLYGLALLLVEAWDETIPVRNLLARMAADGGGADGASLDALLFTTTGAGRDDLLRSARLLRSRYAQPLQLGASRADMTRGAAQGPPRFSLIRP